MWPALGSGWIEIDLDAVAANLAAVRDLLRPQTRLLAVVKADGYGHGAVEVARCSARAGADGLAVGTLPEALELRSHGIDLPILVLTPLRPDEAGLLLDADAWAMLADAASASALQRAAAAAGRRAGVHLLCDSGMGRYGVAPAELPELARTVAACDRLELQGTATHLASAFARDLGPAHRQLARFARAADAAEAALGGTRRPLRHAAASAAVLTLPEAELDMVRVGNLLYGIRPCAHGRQLSLAPAFRMRAIVTQVKTLPAGHGVGYGGEFVTRRPTRVASLAVGLADGLGMEPSGRLLRLGPLLRALVRRLLRRLGLEQRLGLGVAAGGISFGGRNAPVLGRMAMQQVTVDVTHLPDVTSGTAADVHVRPLAANPRLARVYLRDGVPISARTPLGERTLPAQPGAGATGRAAAARG